MKGENSSRPKHKTIKGICVQKCPAIYLEELSSIVDTLNKIGLGLPDNDQSELYNLTSAMAMRTAEKSPGLTIIGQLNALALEEKILLYCVFVRGLVGKESFFLGRSCENREKSPQSVLLCNKN